MQADAIVVIVERGKADEIVKKAKEAGAMGATIFYARGTGVEEARTFLDLRIDSQKEVIVIITAKDETKAIYDVVIKEGNIKSPGKGIIFVLPVSQFEGLHHM
ncbi:P-II family nitrogen regulator [Alkaliphilus peptidifermentans]|uniref:Nitrogen regulatory protein P-II family n=1 Tax=Alkaliphilus peptidifermentans DSM 18978 TaxID=1120976 RepID=A0A1G5KJR8_9FIRM|nr:P-II family nitrogen regulator [Alkaliphilus peptidifermentans]SCZ00837.1 nitrogen regulatory protein P-II family [Alkaliphilus peptidifermentans DSM 18978]